MCNNRANSRQAEKAKSVNGAAARHCLRRGYSQERRRVLAFFLLSTAARTAGAHIGLSAHMPRWRQHLPQQSPATTRLCSLALVDRRNRWAVAVLQYAVPLQPPPQVYGTEFVLGASADEVVGCRELYRRRLAASADRLLFRRRRRTPARRRRRTITAVS